jgi:hypothetical protein
MIISFALFIVFLLGIYYYAIYNDPSYESMSLMQTARCPNILVQQGNRYQLYNSQLDKVPGVNPIEFKNLESYTEFLDWQHSQGIRCPVLYLQKSYDIQGESGYKVRENVHELKGGTPSSYSNNKSDEKRKGEEGKDIQDIISSTLGLESASKNVPENIKDPYDLSSAPCNNNSDNAATSNSPALKDASFVTSEVPVPFYISAKAYDSSDQSTTTMKKSPNPMDPNWGGPDFTQTLIDRGYYKGNEITRI